MIQDVDVVQLSVGNQDEFGNIALEVQQCMQFDRPFGSPKLCPGKQRKAQVDGGGVQGVDRGVEVETEVVAQIELFGSLDEDLSEVGVDAPIALMVGMSEVAVGDRTVNAHVVELGLHHAQTRFDLAQAVSVGQLGERHDPKLLDTLVRADLVVAAVAVDARLKSPPRNELHELRENELPFVHSLSRSSPEVEIAFPISNRNRSFSSATR